MGSISTALSCLSKAAVQSSKNSQVDVQSWILSLMKFHITRHCAERFVERFGKQFQVDSLSRSYDQCRQLVNVSDERRNWMNDSNLVLELHEKYGYERKYHVFVYESAVTFHCVEDISSSDEAVMKVLTCVPNRIKLSRY